MTLVWKGTESLTITDVFAWYSELTTPVCAVFRDNLCTTLTVASGCERICGTAPGHFLTPHTRVLGLGSTSNESVCGSTNLKKYESRLIKRTG